MTMMKFFVRLLFGLGCKGAKITKVRNFSFTVWRYLIGMYYKWREIWKMKMFKKTIIIILTLVLTMLFGVLSFAEQSDTIKEEENQPTIVEIGNGAKLIIKKGKFVKQLSFVEEQKKVSEQIYKETGSKLEAKTGMLKYEPKTSKEIELMATSAPTKEAPNYPFTGNWSGTKNSTYTKYYFKQGDFDADADGVFDADFYYKDGRYGGTIAAEYNHDTKKYEVRAFTDGMEYYYVVLKNQASDAARGATYTAYANIY